VPAVWFYHSNFPRVIAPRPRDAGPARRVVTDLAWRYVRRLGAMVEATIAPCRALAEELAEAGLRNVTHVPLGVSLERFTPARRVHADEIRLRFGLPPGRFALYVGRLAVEKDLDVLLAAWPAVERRTGVRLVLVGMGPARRRLMRGPGGAGAIWLPYERDRDQLADLYAAAEMVVAPCPIETFGLAALEAIASGVPVLAADRGGVAETVERSGAGRHFVSGHRDSLIETAVALLGDDLFSLGARGRAYAVANHGWDAVFDRLFEVYRRVLGR
jgi:alpha-1,6-mannosyltransferase